MNVKKGNVIYWDLIEGKVEQFLEDMLNFGGIKVISEDDEEIEETEETEKICTEIEMDDIKEITGYVTEFLTKKYKANFPFVNEDY